MITNKEKNEWKYLLFYDVDRPINQFDKDWITENLRDIASLIYSTKQGFHFVGLTPLDCFEWAVYFEKLKDRFHEYYSGHTIRLSLKKKEEQKLIMYNDKMPVAYPLARIYEERFNISFKYKIPMLAIFEQYQTRKS
jgi:hypothetical protein